MAHRLTDYLVSTGALRHNPIVVVDAGAAGGFERYWNRVYGDQVLLYGFDPNEKEVHQGNQHIFRIALDVEPRKRKFYVLKHANASSFYRPDPKKVSRYAWDLTMAITSVRIVKTIDLDSFMSKNHLPSVDWIKADVEGAELDILKGAPRALGAALGISIEALFRPVRIGQPTFHQVDAYLDKRGFDVAHLKLHKHQRRTLTVCPFRVSRGQLTWTQATYFKRMVEDIKTHPKLWNAIRLAKAASILEIYNMADVAIHVLQTAREAGVAAPRVVTKFINLLTPVVDGKVVSYEEYWRMLKESVETTGNVRRTVHSYKRWLGRVS